MCLAGTCTDFSLSAEQFLPATERLMTGCMSLFVLMQRWDPKLDRTVKEFDYLKCREWEYANNVSNLLIMFLWFRVEMHTSVSLWCESLSFPCTSLMFVWNLVNLEKRFVADKWSSLLNPQKEMKEVFFCSGPFDNSGSEICIGPEEPNWLISSLNWFKGELQKSDRTDNCMEHRVRVLLCTAGQLTKMRLLVSFCLQEKHCRQFKILN